MSASDRVRGPAPPPRGRPVPPRVVWPLPGERLTLVLLSDLVVSYWTHWLPTAGGVGGRTALCLGHGEVGQCPYATTRKWCGYVAAQLEGNRQNVVAMLTEQAARSLLRAAAGETALRGLVVGIARGEGPTNGVVTASLLRHVSARALSPEFAVGPSLRAMWRLPDLPECMVDYLSEGEVQP